MDAILLKYHSQGNDYLIYDSHKNDITLDAKTIRVICERTFCIGSVGILAGCQTDDTKVALQMYRPDGKKARLDRLGSCIYRKYMMDQGYNEQQPVQLMTEEGMVSLDGAVCDCAVTKIGKILISKEYIDKNRGSVQNNISA